MERSREAFHTLKGRTSNRWKTVANAVKKNASEEERASRRLRLGDRFFSAFHSLTKHHNLEKETSHILRHIPQPGDERLMLEEEQATRGEHDVDEVYLSLLQSILHGPLAASEPGSVQALLTRAKQLFEISDAEHEDILKQASTAVRVDALQHEAVLERLSVADATSLASVTPKHDLFCVVEIVSDHKTRKKGDPRPTLRSDVLLQTQRVSAADEEVEWPESFSCLVPDPREAAIQIELWADTDNMGTSYHGMSRQSTASALTSTDEKQGQDTGAPRSGLASLAEQDEEDERKDEGKEEEEDEEENESKHVSGDDGEADGAIGARAQATNGSQDDAGDGSAGSLEESASFASFSQLNPDASHEPTVADVQAMKAHKNKTRAKRIRKGLLKRLKRVRKAVGSAAHAVRSTGSNLSTSLSSSMQGLNTSTASSSSVFSPAEDGPILVGRGFIPLSSLGRDATPVTVPLFLNGRETGACITATSLVGPADRGSVCRAARERHGHVIQKIFFHCVREFQREIGEQQTTAAEMLHWDGYVDDETAAILKQHSEWCSLSATEARLDIFCTLMELHAHYPVDITVIHRHLSAIASRSLQSLSKADMARLVASLQAVYSYSFPIASSPFHFDASSPNDRTTLKAHVDALKCVFDIPAWQQTIAQGAAFQHVEARSLLPRSPVMDAVHEFLATKERVTYIHLKKVLIRKFGEETFLEHKGQVQSVLLKRYELSSHAKARNPDDTPLSVRLPQVLKQCPCKELTFQKVKDKLLQEYPPAVVDSSKKCICVALVHELNERREHSGASRAAQITLSSELQESIAESARERYVLLKSQARPESVSDTSDLEQYALVAALLLKNIQTCHSLTPCFQAADDVDFVAVVAKAFDAALCQDIKFLLTTRGEEMNEKHEVPVKFFELYFELHNLHEFLAEALPTAVMEDLHLSRFWTWFQPFVIEWLYLSKVNCKDMILRSLELDTWKPINEDSGELFSTSVIDCYRILFDILSFWAEIDWPDVEAAEEYLFAHLSESICFCVRFYAEEMTKHVIKAAQPAPGSDVLAYTIPDMVFTGLNNLCFASEKLHEVHSCMEVDKVQTSHMHRAQIANQGHAGRLKPHKSVRHFDETNECIDTCMRHVSKAVADVLLVRIKNDVRSIATKYAQHSDDGDAFVDKKLSSLLGSPDEHVAATPASSEAGGSVDPGVDRSYASRMQKRQSRMRTSSVVSAVMTSNPSFLFNNFDLMMVKLQHTASIDILLEEVWRSVMVLLRQVYLNEVQTPLHDDQTKLLRFILALRSSFKAFFAGGGEGLADSIMEEISDEEFNTVLNFSKMGAEELLDTFFKLASELQSDPIATAIAQQHNPNAPRVCNHNYKPQTDIGDMLLELLYDRTEDTLKLTVRGVLRVPQRNTYLNVRLLPSFEGPPFKARSSVRKEDNAAYSESFVVPNISSARAVQVRVQTKSFIKLDKVIGEVLLDTHAVSKLAPSRSVRLTMPLFSLNYHGKPGWLQQCIANLAEAERIPELKTFLAKYQQRSNAASTC